MTDGERRRPDADEWRLWLIAAGGYAYLALLVAVFALATYWMLSKGFGAAAFAPLALIFIVLGALRVPLPVPVGVALSRADAPQLFQLVEEVRAAVGAPPLHVLVLTPDVNASVVDLPRWVVFGSRRVMTIGVPLLAAMPADELRATIAHELAHLAHHGRLRLWAVRVLATWTAIATSAQWRRAWGSFLFVPFFRWYGGRLRIAMEAASRGDEHESDAIAASHAGREATIRALVRIGLVQAYQREEALPRLWRGSANRTGPDVESFDLALTDVSPDTWSEAETWIEGLLEERTLDLDSHPSLSERLAHIGLAAPEPSQLIELLARSEGVSGLHREGPPLRKRVSEVAQAWLDATRSTWSRLEADVDVWQSAAAGADDGERRWVLWSLARWSAFCEPPEVAIQRLRDTLTLTPGHAEARLLLGQLLVRRPDHRAWSEGVRLLEGVLAEESRLAQDACEPLERTYARQGRAHDVARCKAREAELADEFLRSLGERGVLEAKDTLRAYDLPRSTRTRLSRELAEHGAIRRAFLIQKHTRHLSESPVVMLVVDIGTAWYKPSFGRRRDEIITALAQETTIPESLDLVVFPLERPSRLARRLDTMAGAALFIRGDARLPERSPADPQWIEPTFFQRLPWIALVVAGIVGLFFAAGALALLLS